MHWEFDINQEGQDYICGDVHGCVDLLQDTLNAVGFSERVDRLFIVGDLIDRGEASYEALRLLYEPYVYCVKGNHEDLMLSGLHDRQAYSLWYRNGGGWFEQLTEEEKSYLVEQLIPAVEELPLFITLNHKSGKRIGICHAEPPTTDWNDVYDWENMKTHSLINAIWGRNKVNGHLSNKITKNIDYTFHGHTIVDKVTQVGNSFFIDTGSFLSLDKWGGTGYITVINLDDFLSQM